MPKSRVAEALGVQRVRVGNKAKSEAWLVKGSSCKYVLVAVFVVVGFFVAAIVATQITFVSEKHKLVQEEKAHEAMEVVLEKRFLEVGSLLENELRRRLKHGKMSDAVHASVQTNLDSVEFPSQTVYAGDGDFDVLVGDVTGMARKVATVMHTYATQMQDEAERSGKLLAAIARHLGGQETDILLKDTAAVAEPKGGKGSKQAAGKTAAKDASADHRGGRPVKPGSVQERARLAKERMAKRGSTAGGNGAAESADGVDAGDELRANIREKMLRDGKGRPRMRKEKDLRSKSGADKAASKNSKGKNARGGKQSAAASAAQASGARAGSADGASDFIAGRDLQSLLIRFFMRLNKIDSVVFPDAVKAKITEIKEKHQEAVADIEAESSTKRERSQKLHEHWDATIAQLKQALDQDGVVGVELHELSHSSWMVDELLKEMQNVIDVQDLQEPLFALEDKFKSGQDADAVFVMKELQKMARTGDLPYEWVFGGSTGMSTAGSKGRGGHGVAGGGMRRPRHGGRDGDEDDGFDDGEEDDEDGDPRGGMMGGAPQYMWWREYPRQVDNPHWKPPPGMMDNFEFLDREREETKHRRDEDLRQQQHRRERRQREAERGDGSGDDSYGDDDEFPDGPHRGRSGPHRRGGRGGSNHTRPDHGGRPRIKKRPRWGDFGSDEGDGDGGGGRRRPGQQHAGRRQGRGFGGGHTVEEREGEEEDGVDAQGAGAHHNRKHLPPAPPHRRHGAHGRGTADAAADAADADDAADVNADLGGVRPRGGFRANRDKLGSSISDSNSNDNTKPRGRAAPPARPDLGRDADDLDYMELDALADDSYDGMGGGGRGPPPRPRDAPRRAGHGGPRGGGPPEGFGDDDDYDGFGDEPAPGGFRDRAMRNHGPQQPARHRDGRDDDDLDIFEDDE